MGINKKFMAAIMVGVLTLSSAFTVSAAGTASETTAPAAQSEDPNTVDHLEGKKVTSDVDTTKQTANVKSVKSSADAEVKNAVVLNNARDSKGNKVPITSVGTGKKKGVFNKIITRVTVKSEAKNVTFKAYAFKKSKVKTLKLNNAKTTINKNAFNGTKAKNVKIYVNKGKLVAKKGAFKGLSSKAKIIVSKKAYSKKAFNKLKKALKKAGFKGKITRK